MLTPTHPGLPVNTLTDPATRVRGEVRPCPMRG